VSKRKMQHSLDILTPEQRKEYDEDRKRYMEQYPFLKEAVAQDFLHELLLIKARIAQLTPQVLKQEDIRLKLAISKHLNDLQRTFQLYCQRLGITYSPRKRRKEPKRKRVITKDDDK